MTKFRKITTIEAEQWFPDHPVEGVEYPVLNNFGYVAQDFINQGRIETLEGSLHVTSGDWIATGPKGEKYPIKPNIFKITYEKVE